MLSFTKFKERLDALKASGHIQRITQPCARYLLEAEILYHPYQCFERAWEAAITAIPDKTITRVFLAEYALNFVNYIYRNDADCVYQIEGGAAAQYLLDRQAVVLDFAPFPVPYAGLNNPELMASYRAVLMACTEDHLDHHLTMLEPKLAGHFSKIPTYKRFGWDFPLLDYGILQRGTLDDRILRMPKLGQSGLANRIVRYFSGR